MNEGKSHSKDPVVCVWEMSEEKMEITVREEEKNAYILCLMSSP